MAPRPTGDFNQHSKRIQELIGQIEALPDHSARRLLHECLQSLLALYGDGLARVLQLVGNAGAQGQPIRDALLQDKLIRGLLLIHDLHPDSLETRLQAALEKVRPYLKSHGGNVELVTLENDVARLRLHGSCESCPSSSVTLELAVRNALEEACPDLAGFEVEGLAASDAPKMHLPGNPPQWTVVEGLDQVRDGEMRSLVLSSVPLVVCRAKGNLYAYRNVCPACHSELSAGSLQDATLNCQRGHRFDVRRAGLSADGAGIHLDPFPLVALNGVVKISAR